MNAQAIILEDKTLKHMQSADDKGGMWQNKNNVSYMIEDNQKFYVIC